MNNKKAKKLKKAARAMAAINPMTTFEKEYKKLKTIHQEIKNKK